MSSAVNIPYRKKLMHINDSLPIEILGGYLLDTYIASYAQCFIGKVSRLQCKLIFSNVNKTKVMRYEF